MATTKKASSCDICSRPWTIEGSTCRLRMCEPHFESPHLDRNPSHRPNSKADTAWRWISGKLDELTETVSRANHFRKDEATKWFGLHVEVIGKERVTSLIEIPRFIDLVEKSNHHRKASPSRQFPRIICFLGETGAGKSTLSMSRRSFISHLLWQQASGVGQWKHMLTIPSL
jgi:hypothetical protein